MVPQIELNSKPISEDQQTQTSFFNENYHIPRTKLFKLRNRNLKCLPRKYRTCNGWTQKKDSGNEKSDLSIGNTVSNKFQLKNIQSIKLSTLLFWIVFAIVVGIIFANLINWSKIITMLYQHWFEMAGNRISMDRELVGRYGVKDRDCYIQNDEFHMTDDYEIKRFTRVYCVPFD